MASYATQYRSPSGLHSGLPNYLWLEAGQSFGVDAEGEPSLYHQNTAQHLVTLLKNAGQSWRAYAEGISGKRCPLGSWGLYTPRHLGMLFFDDVTGDNSATSAECISHVRPFAELANDLGAHTTARYNLIVPDLCNDMQNTAGCATADSIRNGDDWLAKELPKLLSSTAYNDHGAIFITWAESETAGEPIGMIVLSPLAKGGGYYNSVPYTHSSLLKTIQEIFGVTPLLGDAEKATDLSDLFTSSPAR